MHTKVRDLVIRKQRRRTMEFSDEIKNGLTEFGQGMLKKAKDTKEVIRLKNQNRASEKKIEEILLQIGKEYYANYLEDCEKNFPELTSSIQVLEGKLALNNEMIERIASEGICPNCRNKVIPESMFCNHCGEKISAKKEEE